MTSPARFCILPASELLRLFRAWETELSPADNEALLDEMARRGMTGDETLEPELPAAVGG